MYSIVSGPCRKSFSELSQEPDVVRVQVADVGDAVLPHADSLDAEAKREAGHFFRIVTNRPQDVRIHHSGTADLHPLAIMPNIAFDARLRERKETGAKANLKLLTKIRLPKHLQYALQVGHRHPLVDAQAFNLVEHWVVRRIGRVGPIDAA